MQSTNSLNILASLKLPAIKSLFSNWCIARPTANASVKQNWIDALQEYADANQVQIADLFSDIAVIAMPIVTVVTETVTEVFTTAIEVATPIVIATIATVRAFVTDPQTHETAKLRALQAMHIVYMFGWFAYTLGQDFRKYYETIAPLDPYGRVMQITADIGSLTTTIPDMIPDIGSIVVDDVVVDEITDSVRSASQLVSEVWGVFSFIAPIVIGMIVYNLSDRAYALSTAWCESSDHYALTRDNITA